MQKKGHSQLADPVLLYHMLTLHCHQLRCYPTELSIAAHQCSMRDSEGTPAVILSSRPLGCLHISLALLCVSLLRCWTYPETAKLEE